MQDRLGITVELDRVHSLLRDLCLAADLFADE